MKPSSGQAVCCHVEQEQRWALVTGAHNGKERGVPTADLTGFPSLLLQVGTNEVLIDDYTRLAERARAAGVDVILDITANVPHVFQAFAGLCDEADQALDRAALFLRQHTV